MSSHDDLSDDELLYRLLQSGRSQVDARKIVRHRSDPAVARLIEQILGVR